MANETKAKPFGTTYKVEDKTYIFKYGMGLIRELNKVTKHLEGSKAKFDINELVELDLISAHKVLWAVMNNQDKKFYSEAEIDEVFPLYDDEAQAELVTAIAGMMQEAVNEKKKKSQAKKKKSKSNKKNKK